MCAILHAVRVIALVAAYNEERFIGDCIAHLAAQGVETYVIDNGSTDGTREIVESLRGDGVAGVEGFPRDGVYSWRPILERKEELAQMLQADWFLHVDADEIRLPPSPDVTLAAALAEVDADGNNAVNFQEFTFVPTVEQPDHDHPSYATTMTSYYAFLPKFPDRLNAWRRQEARVDLAGAGGHRVDFPGLRMHPVSFPMRHYLFLSVPHAVEKYVRRRYDATELAHGWHRARARLEEERIVLPSERDLLVDTGDGRLDASNPRTTHFLFEQL